jgi:hypothetical protein
MSSFPAKGNVNRVSLQCVAHIALAKTQGLRHKSLAIDLADNAMLIVSMAIVYKSRCLTGSVCVQYDSSVH